MGHVTAIVALLALAGAASANAQDDARSQVAVAVYMAEIGPTVCTELKTDPAAVAALLAHAGITEKDLTGRYKTVTQAAADDFKNAARLRPGPVCSDLWDRLGDGGLRLLTTADED